MPSPKTHYFTLKVLRDASNRDIQISHQKLKKSKTGDTSELDNAFSILNDETKKGPYDTLLNIWEQLDGDTSDDLYARLNLTKDATQQDITNAFETLKQKIVESSKILNEKALINSINDKLNATVNILTDDNKRRAYDQVIDNQDLYQKLHLTEDSTAEEIEKAYQTLNSYFNLTGSKRVLDNLEAAYIILRDPEKRALYNQLMEKDFYKRLGVIKSASTEEIKSQYKSLVLKVHPDRLGIGYDSKFDNILFSNLDEAYKVLVDDSERIQYDNTHRILYGNTHNENDVKLDAEPTQHEQSKYLNSKQAADIIKSIEDNIKPIPEFLKAEYSKLKEIQGKYYLRYWKKDRHLTTALITLTRALQTYINYDLKFWGVHVDKGNFNLSLNKDNLQAIIQAYPTILTTGKDDIISIQKFIKDNFSDLPETVYTSNVNKNLENPSWDDICFHLNKLGLSIDILVENVIRSEMYNNEELRDKILEIKNHLSYAPIEQIKKLIETINNYQRTFCENNNVESLSKYIKSNYPEVAEEFSIIPSNSNSTFENTYNAVKRLEKFFESLKQKYTSEPPYRNDPELRKKINEIGETETEDKENYTVEDKIIKLTYAVKDFESRYIRQETDAIADLYYDTIGRELEIPENFVFENLSGFLAFKRNEIQESFIQKIKENFNLLDSKEKNNFQNFSFNKLHALSMRIDARKILKEIDPTSSYPSDIQFNNNVINQINDLKYLKTVVNNFIGNKEDIQSILKDKNYTLVPTKNNLLFEQVEPYKNYIYKEIEKNHSILQGISFIGPKNPELKVIEGEVLSRIASKTLKDLQNLNKKLSLVIQIAKDENHLLKEEKYDLMELKLHDLDQLQAEVSRRKSTATSPIPTKPTANTHSETIPKPANSKQNSVNNGNVSVKDNKASKSNPTISKDQFTRILNTYESQSCLGYLSTLCIFSWMISPIRSKTMVELQLLLANMQGDQVEHSKVLEAIERGDNAQYRSQLFKNAIKEIKTGTDDVIDSLRNEFNSSKFN